jgi:ATP-dependent DNA helicase RecG
MQQNNTDARKYMAMAIEVMMKSIQEPRDDKVSPKVGAVLIKPSGEIETAFRGELRNGDHAEFTLLERKNRSVPLDGSILFATLEPCAPGARKHPKLSCAERIVMQE